MLRILLPALALLLASITAFGEEMADDAEANQEPAEEQGDGIEKPKTMSGMSILGNEEAPKSLVIIPWKSSELGDDISLSDTLDDRARPVDKEVFLRELGFYEIRAGEDEPGDPE
jgi:hypothetical protein